MLGSFSSDDEREEKVGGVRGSMCVCGEMNLSVSESSVNCVEREEMAVESVEVSRLEEKIRVREKIRECFFESVIRVVEDDKNGGERGWQMSR
ncbi:hypothetical protein COLO4_06418 [Corchorus olitorius]|uniref:Uncharacterized protein n=1 Tax=Corchorus olitorius TaxID=93759 RepID=A0A1R3KN24_9ROSI|nr:hypothetical protein COLO4_06418 [Corchorus olitorius]